MAGQRVGGAVMSAAAPVIDRLGDIHQHNLPTADTSRAMADEAETERVTFTIANPRTVNSKSLYALVDVEVQVAGLSFGIIGVQIRHGSGGLSVHLPTHRDVNGAWRPVVEMPEELLRPLGSAVMEFLAEEGLAERKSALTKLLFSSPHRG